MINFAYKYYYYYYYFVGWKLNVWKLLHGKLNVYFKLQLLFYLLGFTLLLILIIIFIGVKLIAYVFNNQESIYSLIFQLFFFFFQALINK